MPLSTRCTALALLALVCTPPVLAGQEDGPTEADWIQLFDGTTLDGWIPKIRQFDAGENFANTFRAEDGLLKVRYDGYADVFDDRFGHLFYETPFSHYRLSLEYRFTGRWLQDTPGWAYLNSGVMLHSQNPGTMPPGQDFPISVEVQFLGELEPGSPAPPRTCAPPGRTSWSTANSTRATASTPPLRRYRGIGGYTSKSRCSETARSGTSWPANS